MFPHNSTPTVAPAYDKSYTPLENLMINWNIDDLMGYLDMMKRRESGGSPILPSSPEIFRFH